VDIYLFGKCVQVDLLCPILFISSDTPAADKLCGHYSSYSEGVKHVTCSCNVPFDKLDDPNFLCHPVTWHKMNVIATSGTLEQLASISQHKCVNAFTDILIGDPVYKIYGALPTDTMHALRQRTMSYAMQLIFDCMTAKQKYKLDELAQTFHKLHRQSSRKFFPQTDFSNGVCNLSNMTAAERCGQVFLLVCLSQFEEGWHILNEALLTKGHNTDLGEVLEALEAMCCFDAWTRMDKFWDISHQEHFSNIAKESLAGLLTMVRDRLPRENGNGWKLPTFHNLMHIVSDMCKYGKPKEANTEVGEKNHKVFAKCIGRRCRKQHKTFAKQVAGRLADAFIIEKVASAMQLLDDSDINESDALEEGNTDENEECVKGTHFTIYHDGNKVETNWQSATEKDLLISDEDVLAYIFAYFKTDQVSSVHCCTEYMYNQVFIRCHPSYKGEGPWFDWVTVHFEESSVNGVTYPNGNYPCKVLAIIPKQYNTFIEETSILVQSALARTENDSVLFTEWELMDGYIVVPIDSIHESVFVLELGHNKISVALPYSEWPSCFTHTESS